jgi:hypothetical protein
MRVDEPSSPRWRCRPGFFSSYPAGQTERASSARSILKAKTGARSLIQAVRRSKRQAGVSLPLACRHYLVRRSERCVRVNPFRARGFSNPSKLPFAKAMIVCRGGCLLTICRGCARSSGGVWRLDVLAPPQNFEARTEPGNYKRSPDCPASGKQSGELVSPRGGGVGRGYSFTRQGRPKAASSAAFRQGRKTGAGPLVGAVGRRSNAADRSLQTGPPRR